MLETRGCDLFSSGTASLGTLWGYLLSVIILPIDDRN